MVVEIINAAHCGFHCRNVLDASKGFVLIVIVNLIGSCNPNETPYPRCDLRVLGEESREVIFCIQESLVFIAKCFVTAYQIHSCDKK